MKNNLKVTKNSLILFIAFFFIIILMGVAVIGSQTNKENRSKAEYRVDPCERNPRLCEDTQPPQPVPTNTPILPPPTVILPSPHPTNRPTPTGPTNTPPAGPTNTPVPTGPIVCPAGKPSHDKGNANCDDKISGLDYVIWMTTQCNPEGAQFCNDLRADFNGDKKVNNADYQIWYDNSR